MLYVGTETEIYDDENPVHQLLKFAPATFHQPLYSVATWIKEATEADLNCSRSQKRKGREVDDFLDIISTKRRP